MKFKTTRFDEIEYSEEEVIKFPKGILGFAQLTKYVWINRKESEPFRWLQSVEDPKVAFVLINPLVFFPNYQPTVNEKEIEELEYADHRKLQTYVIVTVPSDPSLMSANLQGPLVVNPENSLAKQMVLVNSPYTPRHFVLDELEKQLKAKEKEARRKENQSNHLASTL